MAITFRDKDCPLTSKEESIVKDLLDKMAWHLYLPFKHRSASFSEWDVYEYDPAMIYAQIKYGVTGEATYTHEVKIKRSSMRVV